MLFNELISEIGLINQAITNLKYEKSGLDILELDKNGNIAIHEVQICGLWAFKRLRNFYELVRIQLLHVRKRCRQFQMALVLQKVVEYLYF